MYFYIFTYIHIFEELLNYIDKTKILLYHSIKNSIEYLVGRIQTSSYT